MQTKDIVLEIKASLTSNPTRTILTILGIVIGIASVIIMLSIGNGAQASISSSINSLGSNVLTVMPGGGGNKPGAVSSGSSESLKFKDLEEIKKISLVDKISAVISSRLQVIAGSKNTNVSVYGVASEYKDIKSLDMEIGIFITDAQNRNFSKVVVLGPTTRDNLFGKNSNPVGQRVKIKSNTYAVVGVLKAKGGSGMSNSDDVVYMPVQTAMQYISGGDYVNSIAVTTKKSEDLTPLQNKITDLLIDRHNIKNKDKDLADFTVMNQADLASTMSSITSIFTILLGSVAGISLLVGGIGIMNMMLTTVRERTKEIGLRKSIGADEKDISRQFLIESIVITCLGGIIGIILGIGVSLLIKLTGLFSTSISLSSIILSFSVSVFIGIVFGYYPAKKASKLNPIEALRYE